MRIGHQCKHLSVPLEILVFVLYENKFEVTTKNCDKTIVVYFQSNKLVIIAHNITIIPNKSDVFKMIPRTNSSSAHPRVHFYKSSTVLDISGTL